jgi:GMP synthase (glutamine-hydrolysing)
MRTAFVIQHGVDSPPGMIGEAAEARGFELVPYIADVENAVEYPDPAEVNIIIVTGSVGHWYELDKHPHLQRELAFLRAAVSTGTPIIGMCFGGQGLSLALGGEVEDAGGHEIGWFEVESTDETTVPKGPWFTWHNDKFSLPEGGQLLARSDFSIQAFRLGPHLGLQFHPEVNYDVMSHWVPRIPDGVDTEAFIRETKEREPEARARANALFDTFLLLGEMH